MKIESLEHCPCKSGGSPAGISGGLAPLHWLRDQAALALYDRFHAIDANGPSLIEPRLLWRGLGNLRL